MSQPQFVTLLTDFGLSDVYVGVMKGVMAQINPQLQVIDLTHQIPPQNIAAGRFCLMNAVPYFPPGTVHVAVVDPGVGTRRRAIALQLPTGYLVGPDNGLLSGAIDLLLAREVERKILAVELTNPTYWRTTQPSTTFHGRDIFAAVAAHLASGVPLQRLGDPIDPDTLVQFDLRKCVFTDEGIEGCIQYIDQFGNLITNIPGHYVYDKTWFVAISELENEEVENKPKESKDKTNKDKKKKKGKPKKEKISNGSERNVGILSLVSRIIPSGRTYGEVQPGNLIAIIGSHGWVEIAANGSNAQSILMLDWGSKVQVLLSDSSEIENGQSGI